ncbi:type I-E CRISPR-associated protein Cas5/CasD [Anaeromyxobacter paludicola]|uniref:Type I-E CRISPR-associated protein Cas5/CasD n=1 Tax=Anaeromyxobacter paludicola TaxID=2918171 RepID=A0ABM7XDZ1_9BACT|nr:type I-E CRISPR-associated protein Cas5/CasD [Anaeromyxobacter paludicola]BDG10094.1 type I-E CRISPR-associated protein Cas5/CasD [Anaeromyxobacter paludicola]
MPSFLCFRLHGPLASWGEIAVGERRPSAPHPSRSAVLGILAAALGVRRDDSDAWGSLDAGIGFASRTEAPGQLLVDFHTAQGPGEKLLRADEREARKRKAPWHRPATRKEELAFARADLDTLLSSRQYRLDALWTVALWAKEGAALPWSIDAMRDALRRPTFVPYLGRKSCPLDVPLEPQVVEAPDPVTAIASAGFGTDELLAMVIAGGRGSATVQWEGAWPGLAPEQTVRRRDRVLSRSRWQFTEREEHQKAWSAAPEKGNHVPEQG